MERGTQGTDQGGDIDVAAARRVLDGWEWGVLTHWEAMVRMRQIMGSQRDLALNPRDDGFARCWDEDKRLSMSATSALYATTFSRPA